MSRGVLRPKEPDSSLLAKRPNNRWCEHCKNWVHKDLFAAHLKKKHGLDKATIDTKTSVSRAAARVMHLQSSATSELKVEKLRKSEKVTGKITAKKMKKLTTAAAEKRREMKRLFRDIDAWNFPLGSQLTSNSSGRLDRGGGAYSNRRKF